MRQVLLGNFGTSNNVAYQNSTTKTILGTNYAAPRLSSFFGSGILIRMKLDTYDILIINFETVSEFVYQRILTEFLK